MEPLIFTSHHWLHREQFELETGCPPEDCLFLLETGAFHCAFENENHTLFHGGDVIFFPKSCSFERQILEPIDFHLICFRPNEDDPLAAELPHGLVPMGDPGRKQALLRMFRRLDGRDDPFSLRMKQHALNDVFFQYLYELSTEEKSPVQAAVQDTLTYLEANFTDVVSLEELAARTAISASALSRGFKSETGMTPTEYAVRLRMDQAKHLLAFTDDTVTAIARHCGYCSVHYFSTVFKNACGCTPTDYRKQLPQV